MESYKSRVDYMVSDNTKVTYSFPFQYLKKKFVKVDVTSTDNTVATLTYGVDYTVTDLSITLTTALEVGKTLTIYRETDTDSIVSWNDGSILLAADMSLSDVQMLHLQEEHEDYLKTHSIKTETTESNETVWDASSHRIHNVADPVDAQDAVTKNYMESVQSGFVQQNTALKDEATKQASAAAVSTANAKTSETNSKTSETNAATSAAAAKVSETNSKTSETNSKTSETNSKTSETKAKTSETKVAVSEANAKTSETNAKSSETKSKDSENAARVSEQNAAESARVATENAMDFNILKINKAYSIGDIAYSSYLPSWARLECVTAGTTAATLPTLPTTAGTYVTDGTAKFILDDVRDGNRCGDIVLKPTLNNGYVKANGATVKASEYPRLLKFAQDNNLCVSDIEWSANSAAKYVYDASVDTLKVPNVVGRVLQGEDELSTKSAGLPNITGAVVPRDNEYGWGAGTSASGAFKDYHIGFKYAGTDVANIPRGNGFTFDASHSSSIYGNSNTVQPPACCLIVQIKY